MTLLLGAALASTPVLVWDLEQDDGGFSAAGELGQWRWGAATSGPGAGYDGSRAWAIGLSSTYLNDATEYLEVPLPDLSAVGQPVLSFAHWYGFGAGDEGYLELDDGTGWRKTSPVYGYPGLSWTGSSGGWELVSVELPATAGARLRFVFAADDDGGVGAGWFVDRVGVWDGDVTAPRVGSLTALPDTEELTGPFEVSAAIEDDTGVDVVTLLWTTSRGAAGSMPMTGGADGSWEGTVPAAPVDTVVAYHVVATDGANAVRYPAASELDFRVYLPAPTALVGPEGRVVATEAALSWTPPVSVHVVEGYDVLQGDAIVAETTLPQALVPLGGVDDTFSVRARYDVGVGDASERVTLFAVVPSLLSVDPTTAYAGESLWVDVVGRDGLFVSDEVDLDFGAGSHVETVVVQNVDRLRVEVRFDDGAVPGARDVTLTSAVGTLTLPAGFAVVDAAARPRVTGLSPARVTQGDSGTLTIMLSAPPATTPGVSLGDGVVVERVVLDGRTLLVAYAVAIRAPLGEHEVLVDDGVRLLVGPPLEVRDWTPAPIASCAAGGVMPGVVLVACAAAMTRRRRAPTYRW